MQWFFSSGDSPFYFIKQFNTFSYLPEVFNGAVGFGSNFSYRLWFDYPLIVISKLLSSLGLSWFILDKVYWMGAWCIGLYSIRHFAKKYFSGLPLYLSLVIYLLNTYSLMIFSGGQYGVFLAYCFLPYVVTLFFDIRDQISFKKILQLAVCLGILISFDLRYAYIAFIIGMVVNIFTKFSINNSFKHIAAILITFILSLLFHLYWILPSIIYPSLGTLGKEFTGSGITSFLSFADFSHSISLLHPNWPENLFGKIYFMQPEFIIIPLVVFSSLLFMKKYRNKNNYIFLYPLAIIGIFLTKGTNEPFGIIYTWLFQYFPGFVMFRDPTKFFVVIALVYSIIIPFTIQEIIHRLGKLGWLVSVLFMLFWGISIRQLFSGDLSGNFHPNVIPQDYQKIESELSENTEFSRILWIPTADRFVFFNIYHPLLTIENLLPNTSMSAQLKFISDQTFLSKARNAGVGYVGVPIDVEEKLFLRDYMFSPSLRQQYVNSLQNTGLTRLTEYKDIAIWKIESHKGLFSLKMPAKEEITIPIHYTTNMPSRFEMNVENNEEGSVIVRYTFDPYWRMQDRERYISPIKTPDGFMEFTVFSGQKRTITLDYLPQKWATIGFTISCIYAIVLFCYLVVIKLRKRKKAS